MRALAVVQCDRGWALVRPYHYRFGLSVGTTCTVHAGRAWQILGERGLVRERECARLYRERRIADARAMCEQGLAAHPRGEVRGALYFDLGRIAEVEGRIVDAREAEPTTPPIASRGARALTSTIRRA